MSTLSRTKGGVGDSVKTATSGMNLSKFKASVNSIIGSNKFRDSINSKSGDVDSSITPEQKKTLEDAVAIPQKMKKDMLEKHSTEAEKKNPAETETKFNEDLNDVSKGDFDKANRTSAGSAYADSAKKADPMTRKEMMEMAGSAAKWGAGLGAFIYFCIKLAQKKSGCYVVKASGERIQACTQSDCSVGSSCGASGGAPRSDGKCCDTHNGKAGPTDTCQCVEVSPWEVAENTMNTMLNAAMKLAETGLSFLDNIGGMLTDLIDFLLNNVPVAIVIIVIIFVAPKIFSVYRSIFPAQPQAQIIYQQPPAQRVAEVPRVVLEKPVSSTITSKP